MARKRRSRGIKGTTIKAGPLLIKVSPVVALLIAVFFWLFPMKWAGDSVRVVDGDTIEVMVDGRQEKVRILGIDTPERGERFYEKARLNLESLCAGRQVSLQPEDGRELKRDKYGRLLAYVHAGDGIDVGAEQLKAGLARMYRKEDFGLWDQYLALEAEAKQKRLGIWR